MTQKLISSLNLFKLKPQALTQLSKQHELLPQIPVP